MTTVPARKPSIAQRVNSHKPLLARARKCERVRGQAPNLLAVDFYGVGDLFRAADELNRVSASKPSGQ